MSRLPDHLIALGPADPPGPYRALVRELQIRPLIARRGTEHGSGLGKQRWIVGQTFALLHAVRRPHIR